MIPAQHQMSSVDAAWLRMERRTNPMVITGLIVLASPCSLEALKEVIATRFLRYARFREVPVEETLGGHWIGDPEFDLDAHVRAMRLGDPASQSELEAMVGELTRAPLDPRRPRWEFILIEHYQGGSAVVLRIHHCYGDGMALERVFVTLTDREAQPIGARPDASPSPAESDHAEDGALSPWLQSLVAPAIEAAGGVLGAGSTLVGLGLSGLMHPVQTAGQARDTAAVAAAFGELFRLPDDPPSPLRGLLSTRKGVACAPPLSLVEVKTVGRLLGCTVNDVLMSTAAGALGSHLRRHGFDPTDLVVRATVPVNLRPADAAPGLGNHFGMVLVDLPLGLRHPLERLYAVQGHMAALKTSKQPLAVFAALSVLGALPVAAETLAIDILSRKASLVMSNVPGPRDPLYLCGQRITHLYFWVPQSGSVGLGISLLSYAKEVHFGLIADHALIPEPAEIAAQFVREFEQLLLVTLFGATGLADRWPLDSAARRQLRRARLSPARRRVAPSRPGA